jgi:hypothetical protein
MTAAAEKWANSDLDLTQLACGELSVLKKRPRNSRPVNVGCELLMQPPASAFFTTTVNDASVIALCTRNCKPKMAPLPPTSSVVAE